MVFQSPDASMRPGFCSACVCFEKGENGDIIKKLIL